MCRALKVLCLAPDPDALAELKRAAVSADWELAPGATSEREAADQLERERPHVIVAFGGFERLLRQVRDRLPTLRIVTDRPVDVETVVVTDPSHVRAAIRGLPPPAGPVR